MSEIEQMKEALKSDITNTLCMAPEERCYYIVCKCLRVCECVMRNVTMPLLALNNCYSQEMVDWVTYEQPLVSSDNIIVKANCQQCYQRTMCGRACGARLDTRYPLN